MMGFAVLFLLLLLASCSHGVAVAETAGQRQYHRSLGGYVLPYQIRWKLNIADIEGVVPEDRQPTQEEYEGIRQANVDFFTEEIPLAYSSETDFTFREVDCQIEETQYDPADDEWVHEVLLGCEVVWDADTLDDTPTAETFLLDMNEGYLLDNFVNNYLRKVDPQSPANIFQFSSKVGYITNNAGTRGPYVSDGTTDVPGAVPGTDAPAPTMTPPTAPPPTGPDASSTPPPSGVPQQKLSPPSKCGSLASDNARGGSAADAKDCTRRLEDGKKRKLKGSNY